MCEILNKITSFLINVIYKKWLSPLHFSNCEKQSLVPRVIEVIHQMLKHPMLFHVVPFYLPFLENNKKINSSRLFRASFKVSIYTTVIVIFLIIGKNFLKKNIMTGKRIVKNCKPNLKCVYCQQLN